MRQAVLIRRGTGKRALDIVREQPLRGRLSCATEVGVSEPMILWARRIVRIGTPELIIAVEEGRVALYMAARVSRWSPPAQLEFLRLPPATAGGSTLSSRCLTAPPVAPKA